MKPHRARILAMQALFQIEFQKKALNDLLKFDWIDYVIPDDEKKFAGNIIKGVLENSDTIDKIIRQYSKNWDINRISRVSKAILRLSIYQIMEMKNEIPFKVVIDEAVRLSKKYAEEDASRFINGILDTFYRQEIKE
jgi:N utilization substance protein B